MNASNIETVAFLSYHRSDHALVAQLKEHLVAADIRVFFDRESLAAGEPWPQALEEALQAASGVVVFLGPEGLGPWQKREVFFALDRQAQAERLSSQFPVIPVLLPGTSIVPGFLFLNTWIDLSRVELLAEVANSIVRTLRHGLSTTVNVNDVCPFRGLRPFREEHAAFFFGRESLVTSLSEKVRTNPIVGVVGPSGSGKSSVVLAGLLPDLRRRRPPETIWDVIIMNPGRHPWRQLAEVLVPLLQPSSSEETRIGLATALTEDLRKGDGALESAIATALRVSRGTDRILLVVDQLEELFTQALPEVAPIFLAEIFNAGKAVPLSVVFTLRADFYGRALNASRPLSDALMSAQINIGPMRREEVRRTIELPAARLGLKFEPGLVETLLDAVESQPGNLPLLQYALTSIWNERVGGYMTHAAFRKSGGVTGAIASRCDSIVASLSDSQRVAARHLFGQLVHLASPDEEGANTRRRARRDELAAPAWEVAERFAAPENRLLVISQDAESGQQTVEIAHEAMVRHWNVLRTWLDEDRQFLEWLRQLEVLRKAWDGTNGTDRDTLLRGKALADAKRWLRLKGEALSDTDVAFVRASIKVNLTRGWIAIGAGIFVTLLVLLIVIWGIPRWRHTRAQAALTTYGATVTQLDDGVQAIFYADERFRDEAIVHLASLSGLRTIDLSETPVTDAGIRLLNNLPNIRVLNMADTEISNAALEQISMLGELTSLNLSNCRRLDAAGFPQLARLGSLQNLLLDDTQFGDDDIAVLLALKNLRMLSLEGTRISDRALAAISQLAALESLWLNRTTISDAGLSHLSKMKSLSILNLTETKVNGQGLSHLQSIASLRDLNLRMTALNPTAISALGSIRSLLELDVSNTGITDSSLSELVRLTQLKKLWLIGNVGITDLGMGAILRLRSLGELYIGGTSIGDEGLRRLSAMPSLRKLWVLSTSISDAGLRAAVSSDVALEELNVYKTSVKDETIREVNARIGRNVVVKRAP